MNIAWDRWGDITIITRMTIAWDRHHHHGPLERRITQGSYSLDCRVNVFGIAAYYNYRWTAGETSSEIGPRVLPLTGAAGISSSPGVLSLIHI